MAAMKNLAQMALEAEDDADVQKIIFRRCFGKLPIKFTSRPIGKRHQSTIDDLLPNSN